MPGGSERLTSKKQTTIALKESKRVMVLRGRRARSALSAFTLWVLFPAGDVLQHWEGCWTNGAQVQAQSQHLQVKASVTSPQMSNKI